MEPEVSTPKIEAEQSPVQYGQQVERGPRPSGPETGFERGAERYEQVAEARAAAADSAGLGTILPPPVLQPAGVSPDSTLTSGPITASDEDLIEKEWVDRAKKIIAETRDDPFKREAAVNQLQRDYQKKRYGRELGEA